MVANPDGQPPTTFVFSDAEELLYTELLTQLDSLVSSFPSSMTSAQISDFEYAAPKSLRDLSRLMKSQRQNAEVKLLAGGMSLLSMMKLGLLSPSVIIDLGGIKSLRQLSIGVNVLRVGSMTRYVDILDASHLREFVPELFDCISQIGDMQVRNRGTIGGAIAHADPAGDLNACLLALGTRLVIMKANGKLKDLDIADFFEGPFSTKLKSRDVLVEARILVDKKHKHGGAYVKLERTAGDFATAGAAVSLWFGKTGKIVRAGIGLTNASDRPLKVESAEHMLVDSKPNPELIEKAAVECADRSSPSADVRGDEEYKRKMLQIVSRRAMMLSLHRLGVKFGEETR